MKQGVIMFNTDIQWDKKLNILMNLIMLDLDGVLSLYYFLYTFFNSQ
jgi:hypothetical protein